MIVRLALLHCGTVPPFPCRRPLADLGDNLATFVHVPEQSEGVCAVTLVIIVARDAAERGGASVIDRSRTDATGFQHPGGRDLCCVRPCMTGGR